MAIAVEVIKLDKEDEQYVYYRYRSAETTLEFGEIRIDKKTGNVILDKISEGDESEAQARRASWALIRCFKNNEFPEKTWWQS